MKIKVRLFDALRKFAPTKDGEFILNLYLEPTVASLLRICGLSEEKVAVVMVNGGISPLGTVLQEEDEVSVFPVLTVE